MKLREKLGHELERHAILLLEEGPKRRLGEAVQNVASFVHGFPTQSIIRIVENLALPEREKKPLVVCYYLTDRCNGACSFCSQKENVRRSKKEELPPEEKLRLLEIIRADASNIYLMGGEPTLARGFKEVLEECTRLEFERIVVNTNAILYKPEILEHATDLVISLHCDCDEKTANIYKISPEKAKRVYENILRYCVDRDFRRTRIVINCVVTEGNIDDVYDVADFAIQHGCQLSVAPAIDRDGKPDPGLINNPEYQKMIDWLKTKRTLVFGRGEGYLTRLSGKCLQTLRGFEPFTCTPNVVPGVRPNGNLVIPCQPLSDGKGCVNLLETGSVHGALKIGREQWEFRNGILDTQKMCRDRCHKICYVETAALGTTEGVRDFVRVEFARWKEMFDGASFKDVVIRSPKREKGDLSPNEKRRLEEASVLGPERTCAKLCINRLEWLADHPGEEMPGRK
jgi:MoaA/NifB/PqqE/SkfB family radical SAM enzyme